MKHLVGNRAFLFGVSALACLICNGWPYYLLLWVASFFYVIAMVNLAALCRNWKLSWKALVAVFVLLFSYANVQLLDWTYRGEGPGALIIILFVIAQLLAGVFTFKRPEIAMGIFISIPLDLLFPVIT